MSMYGLSSGPRNPLISILVTVLVLVGMYYLISGVFNLLMYASPILIIAAAVIHFPTVVKHAKGLIEGIQKDVVKGSLWLLVNVVFFPITFAFILIKAFANRKMDKMRATFEEKGTTGNPIVDGLFTQQQQQRPNKQQQAPTAPTSKSSIDEEYIDFEELPPIKPDAASLPKTDRGNYGNNHDDMFK